MSAVKDCVASFLRVEGVGQFVSESEVLQGADSALKLPQTRGEEHPVNLSAFVAHTQGHDVAVSVTCGFVRHGGKDFVVVDSRLFSVDELRFQGVLSGGDIGELAYVLKYLRKACANLVPEGV